MRASFVTTWQLEVGLQAHDAEWPPKTTDLHSRFLILRNRCKFLIMTYVALGSK